MIFLLVVCFTLLHFGHWILAMAPASAILLTTKTWGDVVHGGAVIVEIA